MADSLLFALNVFPRPLLEGSFYWQISYCIEAAAEIGLFDALSMEGKSLQVLATELDVDITALSLLTNVLEISGYLTREISGKYMLTRVSKKWLTSQGKANLQINIRATKNLRKRWGTLTNTIRYGFDGEDTYQYFNRHPQDALIWHRALAELAKQIAPAVAKRTKFSVPPAKLLDLGGSHGLYAVEFCRRYPLLKATIFDKPIGVQVGKEIIAAEGYGDRISFVEGDFWLDELNGTYDAILLFNILHANSIDRNVELLKKCKSALTIEGSIIVFDQIDKPVGSYIGKMIAALISLNLYNETGGRVLNKEDITSIIKISDLKVVQTFQLVETPGCEAFILKNHIV